ncbi:MAG: heme-binding protein [Pseudomonadota bacterium]|nr:heme-binding protein [Pseudomonadota bacterium]
MINGKFRSIAVGALLLASNAALSQVVDICPSEASRDAIHTALKAALVQATAASNGGFALNMWGSVVNRDGVVCAVAYTGDDRGDQWPGSRVISAQKANTANAFSLPGLALSTANLWEATQPGGSLFGLQESNPVSTAVAYAGPSTAYGTNRDPMLGQKIGGINVFGGGLPLYSKDGVLVGAIGVSGDSSCADHNIAWRVRNIVKMDYVPAGVAPDGSDQIIFMGGSTGGFGHPQCGGTEHTLVPDLPEIREVGQP